MAHWSPGVLAYGWRALMSVTVALLAAALITSVGYAKPNIIVMLSDDAGYSNFGFSKSLFGVENAFETPNLDALAQQSVVFSKGYVASPVCSPSRAALLTGQNAQRHGFERNAYHGPGEIESDNWTGLTPGQVTIADHLGDLGYWSGAIGKWHLGAVQGLNRPLDKGFDEFYGLLGGTRQYFGDQPLAYRVIRRGEGEVIDWTSEGDPTQYDPERGRYLTDAFGEEAVDFINRNANQEDPFFLYVPFTAPHTPHQAKQADLDHFSHVTDAATRNVAAMTYAMDRAIGDIVGALQDNGIDDETIVVFLNDNGGAPPNPNTPFRGKKGDTFEGGIRMPFFIHGPDLEPGVYEEAVTSLDLLPTFIAAAGGDVASVPTDGVNLLPYLSGEVEGSPSEVMVTRWNQLWAVHRGDWKLVKSTLADGFIRLHNLADDPREQVNLRYEYPEITEELFRELDLWESEMAKPKWGPEGRQNANLFDHFVWRPGATGDWSAPDAWRASDAPEVPETMGRADAYANMVVEFSASNDTDYVANNDMVRRTTRTFMLNKIVMSGDFSGDDAHSATVEGRALLFVNSLEGAAPSLQLDATGFSSQSHFTFHVDNELQLMHDMEITGDGTQEFVLGGHIKDFYEPRNVTKTGVSRVVLAGESSFAGALIIQQGAVAVSGPGANVHGPSSIIVGAQGAFALQDGVVDVGAVAIAAGGEFQFEGGRLSMDAYTGDLTNHGGVLATRATTVSGNYAQHEGGVLEISIGSDGQATSLTVDGAATLAGSLDVLVDEGYAPGAGDEFTVLAASSLAGKFADALNGDTLVQPIGEEVLSFRVYYGSGSPFDADNVVLAGFEVTVPGDFNADGIVDASDYPVYRDGLANGDYDQYDYRAWRDYFGATAASLGAIASGSAVPEPAGLPLLLLAVGAVFPARRPRS